jgi:hypothetical protein
MKAKSKKIKFWNLPKEIKLIKFLFDGEKDNKYLDIVESFSWSAKKEKKYYKITNQIDELEVLGNGWRIYCWYDISGYDYWVKQQEEPNYIEVTISFDKKSILKSEIGNIENALNDILNKCREIENKYFR